MSEKKFILWGRIVVLGGLALAIVWRVYESRPATVNTVREFVPAVSACGCGQCQCCRCGDRHLVESEE